MVYKYCPRCGKELEPSDLEDYAYQCKDCDEDFFEFEVDEISKHELSLALAYIRGWRFGKESWDLSQVIEEIDLSEKEWEHIKKKEDINLDLNEDQIREIDNYFKGKK